MSNKVKILVAVLAGACVVLGGVILSKYTGGGEDSLKIGASPSPHAEILEFVKDDLAQEGINLDVQVFTDYVTPNLALAQGDLDANFFQHVPYLDSFSKENNLNLASIGGVHLEPMAVFSQKYKSIEEIEDGTEVQIPNDPTNLGRALLLLQSQGLIKLDPNAGVIATENDVKENPKNLHFVPLEASIIPKSYAEAGIGVINGNFALQNGLNPVSDSIAIEGSDSPYVNIVAVKEDDKDREVFAKLIKVLQSDKVKSFIEDKYQGSVVFAPSK